MKPENELAGKIFVLLSLFSSQIINNSTLGFAIKNGSIVLVLEDEQIVSFSTKPCVKILVLTGEYKGKIGYDYAEYFRNSYYEEVGP